MTVVNDTTYSALTSRSSGKADGAEHHTEKSAASAKESEATDADVDSLQASSAERRSLLRRSQTRSAPPFIASHDIPRGLLFAFQALLAYILMLAVMCVKRLARSFPSQANSVMLHQDLPSGLYHLHRGGSGNRRSPVWQDG